MSELEEIKDKNFSKYGSQFQLAVLSLFIQDSNFRRKIESSLLPEYFDNKYTQDICSMIYEFKEKYQSYPGFEDLKIIIETTKEKGTKLYLATLDNIKNVELKNKNFVEDEALKFCFIRFALHKLEEEKNNILLGNFDEAKRIAFSIYKPMSADVIEIDLKQDIPKLFDPKNHKGIPTPIPTFNNNMKGGPGAGHLVIIAAASNFGKSNYAAATARTAAEAGFKVAYVSLETEALQLAARTVAGLAKINQEYIADHPELIRKKMNTLKGEIRFIELKATQARISNIKTKIDDLHSQNYFPELIIVDGLNQIKAEKGMKFSTNNDKFEYFAEDLRDYAKELSIPIYACFQLNRSGFNKIISDEQSIGKAIEVYQVADVFLNFNQDLQMLNAMQCHGTILKNRLGPKGVCVKMAYNPNQCTFEEIEVVERGMLIAEQDKQIIQTGLNTVRKTLGKIAVKSL